MRKFFPFVTVLLMAAGVLGLVACKASPEARAEKAVALVREMNQEMLGAEKGVIAKFKALPDVDDVRVSMGKNLDGWAVSEKTLSKNEDEYEQALIGFQKDAKGDALVGELRLYAKKLSKGAQADAAEFEARLLKEKKNVADGKMVFQGIVLPMNDEMKKDSARRQEVISLQVEYVKALQGVADAYEAKLAKLLG
jgi:hypothetical protein